MGDGLSGWAGNLIVADVRGHRHKPVAALGITRHWRRATYDIRAHTVSVP